MINADKFNLLRDIMDQLSKIKKVKRLLTDVEPHANRHLGGDYPQDYIDIHKGQLQQDIIKALNAEIERLEHLAEQLKGEL